MLVGTAIFAAWLFTYLDALEIIGLFFIYGGIGIFAAGIASLLVFVSRARKHGFAHRKPTTVALVVLVLNFPLCVAYVSIAFTMETAHLVTVANRAIAAIVHRRRDVILSFGGRVLVWMGRFCPAVLDRVLRRYG